ncbi:MAG: DUF2045 domain-containing protein [Clostridiales bacterium]|nr:DUF2045 domain-containing protein [Clostridiales bacterium]
MYDKTIVKHVLTKWYRNLRFGTWTTAVFAAAWWGILYPELCFTEETCQAVIVEEAEENAVQREKTQETPEGQILSGEITYRDLFKATGEDVVVKSRLLEWLEQCADDFSE